MDSTRQHLLRVSDIIGEIEGRLRSLRLQAQKAERYKRYKARAEGPRPLVVGAALPRPPGRGEVAGRRSSRRVRESHETESTALEAGEAAADAERLAVTEEATELAAAKDELFALSNKAQLGMQRAEHHDAEAVGAGGAGRGRPHGDRRAARAGGGAGREHRGDRRPAGRDRRGGRRERARIRGAGARCRKSGARRWPRRGASWKRRRREIAAARASIARREAERAGADAAA